MMSVPSMLINSPYSMQEDRRPLTLPGAVMKKAAVLILQAVLHVATFKTKTAIIMWPLLIRCAIFLTNTNRSSECPRPERKKGWVALQQDINHLLPNILQSINC